jgi:hypothetical protein
MKTKKIVEYPNGLKDIKSEYHHNKVCQIILFLSGKTPKDIKEALLLLIDDIDNYGFPKQGIHIYPDFVKEVIRPCWIDIID